MSTKRDPVQTLIDEINGSCRPHILAGINGNIPATWTASNLRAQYLFRASPSIGVWADAYENVGHRYVGVRLEIDAPFDHLKLADELARLLTAKAATARSENLNTVRIKLDEGAKLPERKVEGSSGYDLCALHNAHVQPGRIAVIRTGVHIELPNDMEAQVRPRSGLAKEGLWVHFGTVDRGYTGDCSVLCINHGTEPFPISAGDRIAQLVFSKVEHPEIEVVAELGEGERGDRGFGSTGIIG